jgi:hypothetical protein
VDANQKHRRIEDYLPRDGYAEIELTSDHFRAILNDAMPGGEWPDNVIDAVVDKLADIDYSTGGGIDGVITASDANLAATTDKTIIIPGRGKPSPGAKVSPSCSAMAGRWSRGASMGERAVGAAAKESCVAAWRVTRSQS